MKSEEQRQKFHTVDVHYSDLGTGNACYLCQKGDLSQSIRSTTQVWVHLFKKKTLFKESVNSVPHHKGQFALSLGKEAFMFSLN